MQLPGPPRGISELPCLSHKLSQQRALTSALKADSLSDSKPRSSAIRPNQHCNGSKDVT